MLADIVGTLVGYSLARRHPDGFQVHRLVQAAVRQQLPPDRQQATAERVVALLTAACPRDPVDPAGWAGYAAPAPHVLAAGPLVDQHPAGRQLMLDTIRYLEAKADGSGSRAVGAPLLDRWRAILGSDHPDRRQQARYRDLTVEVTGSAGSPEQMLPARAVGQAF